MSVSVGATCRSGYVTAGATGALGGPVGRACRGVKLLLPIANPVNERRVIVTYARKARRISNRRMANSAMKTGRISVRLQRADWWKTRPIDSADRGKIMPLRKGSGQSVVSSNIKTLVDDWKKDGSIGTSHPPTKKKAIKQAVAIALAKAGKSRNTQ